MAKQKPCKKAGRTVRSEAAKAATAARKLQSQKEQYAALLSSSAFEKAVAKGLVWVAPVEHPINVKEMSECISALNDFLKKSKETVSEKQLDEAQNWVVTVEAKNFNSKKQEEILKLADTDVDAARLASLKLLREFKKAQTKVKQPKLGRIEFGVSNYEKPLKEYKALSAKKQKPILKAKTVKGFAPKQFEIPSKVSLDEVAPVVAIIFKNTYEAEYEAYKKAYLAGVEEERQRKAEETAKAEAERKRQEEERKRLAALRKKQIAQAKAKARQEAAVKARNDFRQFVALHEAAMELIDEARAFSDKELNKRVAALEANLTADFFTLKKKYDFASSALFAVQKVAA